MEFIRKFLEQTVTFTEDDWSLFSGKWRQQEFAKKSFILKAGITENYLSFIEKGIVRFYIPKDDGSELTFVFCWPW